MQVGEAFPWDTVPRYLIRDRDGIYGRDFTRRAKALGIKQVLIAPRLVAEPLEEHLSRPRIWNRGSHSDACQDCDRQVDQGPHAGSLNHRLGAGLSGKNGRVIAA